MQTVRKIVSCSEKKLHFVFNWDQKTYFTMLVCKAYMVGNYQAGLHEAYICSTQ